MNEYEMEEDDDSFPIMIEDIILWIDDKTYHCEISLSLEMIEVLEGNKIWSCSISCKNKYGNPTRILKNMIRNCLNTISPGRELIVKR